MTGRSLVLLALVTVLAACGGAPPPPSAPEPVSAPAKETVAANPAPAESTRDLPSACDDKGSAKVCAPPRAFVKRLCEGAYPDVALSFFAKGTPWTRAYLRMDVEAWNASGGASSSDKLLFDEEVIILFHRVPDLGGMTVSGSGGGYDVLRWDGTCASLQGEEVTMRPPPAPKSAKIPWRSLGDAVQKALLVDAKIESAISERRKECKGATTGIVSIKCVKADAKVTAVVADYVRKGGDVPRPARLP